MAVTVEDLAVALRLSADGTGLPTTQTNILTRLLGVADAHVDLLAPDAPDPVQDEAVVRMAAYLYDQPPVGRRDSYSNAYVNSGAGALLARWAPQAASGSTGVLGVGAGGLSAAQVNTLIELALQGYVRFGGAA